MKEKEEDLLKKYPLPKIPRDEKEICLELLSLFTIEGESGDKRITGGQLVIFWLLIFRPVNRVQIISSTQYGKSLTVALACIIISCIQEEVVAVIAPTSDKAKEIVRYYYQHLGDNILFYSRLDKKTKLDRLRQEESKARIILQGGGGIFVVSTDERNSQKNIESAMGKGAKIVIGDEFGLVGDRTEATVYRMIAGKGEDAFYCKIGNPFYDNHFKKSWDSGKYMRVFIDYRLALKEGRYLPEFIEEARTKPLFSVLYECKFPTRDEVDARGWRYLFSKELIASVLIEKIPVKVIEDEDTGEKDWELDVSGRHKVGADIGRGGDESAFVSRYNNVMFLEEKNKIKDTMQQVVIVRKLEGDITMIDDIGVGSGVTDRSLEEGLNVVGVRTGERASNPERYANVRVELAFLFHEWLVKGGKIVRTNEILEQDDWYKELSEVMYKENSSGKLILEPKDELKERLRHSPNVYDAGALTFYVTPEPDISIA